MWRHRVSVSLYAVAAVVLAHASVAAAGDATACSVIASLPTTIVVPGVYCVEQDFELAMANGAAIEIKADDVTLDLTGHTISNVSAGSGTQAFGIYSLSRERIVLKNGTIRGWLQGIRLDAPEPFTTSGGHLIEDICADRNLLAAIWVDGRGDVIRRNRVTATGGTSVSGANVDAYALYVQGPANRVYDNDVVGVTSVGSGHSYGLVFSLASDFGLAAGNRISATEYGIAAGNGTVKYRDNLTSNVAVPYLNGINLRNND